MKIVELTKGKVAQIDDEVFDLAMSLRWCALRGNRTWYAGRRTVVNGKPQTMTLHGLVFDYFYGPIFDGYSVDHRDHDGLNCQIVNLRMATPQQQNCNRRKPRNNTSGFIGVYWHPCANKWAAHAKINGKTIHLGLFTDKIEAALARDEFVKIHHGAFAVLNFN